MEVLIDVGPVIFDGLTIRTIRTIRSFVCSFDVLQILILPRLGPGSARRYGPTAVAPALAKLKFEILIFLFTGFEKLSIEKLSIEF